MPYAAGLSNYMRFPMHHQLVAQGFGAAIDPACHAKYELAWGPDLMGKGPPGFKAGELPPATPDPSQMFKEGFY